MTHLLSRTALRSLAAATLSLAVLTPGAAADVITVGPVGDYTDIQSAVGAAVHGDVILVASGAYGGVDILDKALTIVADNGAMVEVTDTVSVQLLAAGRTVSLIGLDIASNVSGMPGLYLLDNLGAVRVEDCNIRGLTTLFSGLSVGVMVDDSADVGFRDCTISAGWQTASLIGLPPAPAEGVVAKGPSTTIAFHGGSVKGGTGTGVLTGGGDGGPGGTGLAIQAARVFASGTAFNGGAGAGGSSCDEFTPSFDGGPGGTAVTIQGAPSITWFRHQQSTLTGGAGGPGGLPNPFTCSDQGTAGTDGAALSDPAGVAALVPGTVHALVAPSPVRESALFGLSLAGDPGDMAAVLGSMAPGTSWQAGANGQFMLAAPFQLRIVGLVPASGTLALVTSFPELGPAVESVILYTQPLFLGAGGALTLGAPFVAVVLDGAF